MMANFTSSDSFDSENSLEEDGHGATGETNPSYPILIQTMTKDPGQKTWQRIHRHYQKPCQGKKHAA